MLIFLQKWITDLEFILINLMKDLHVYKVVLLGNFFYLSNPVMDQKPTTA
jgi:hypothetical protein